MFSLSVSTVADTIQLSANAQASGGYPRKWRGYWGSADTL